MNEIKPSCPLCQSNNVSWIFWGYPGDMDWYLKAIDDNSQNLSELASLCKSKLGRTVKLVTNEAIQMHGGIGMTDDIDIGLFLKRARVAQQSLGDYNYHLNRYADISGY